MSLSLASAFPTTVAAPRRPHPFAGLPVEIVNEIFMHCLPPSLEESQPISTQAPLLLCHVSSFWRSAAIADPRLWKRLTLNPKLAHNLSSIEPLSRRTRQMAEQAFLWLANAKDMGLDVDLTIPFPCFDPPDSADDTDGPTFADISEKWNAFIVPILVAQANQLRTLRLSFGVASLLQPFFFADHEQHALSKLESLTIKGDRLQVIDDSSQASASAAGRKKTLKRFSSATRLTKVAILVKNRTPFPLQLPFNFLPWAQLTHLMMLMPCSGSFWKRVLVSCSQLEAGYINIECGIGPDDCIPPPLPDAGYIELPRLRTFDVTFHDEFTSAYFEDFRFPVLHRLLVACDFASGFPTFAWVPFAQNSHFLQELRSLTSLTLSYQNMIETELVEVLRHAVQLEELVLDTYLVDHKAFLQALVVKQDDPKPLVPKLQVFRFFVEYFADVPPTFDEEDFLAVMTSRSELAREVVNNLANLPDPDPKTEDSEYGSSSSSSSESDSDMDEDEKDGRVSNQDMLSALPFTTAVSTTFISLPVTKPTTPRPPLPPISKLVIPIRHVELSTDASDPLLFKVLEKFEAGVKKRKESQSTAAYPEDLIFRLDFSSPSDWALQDSEPFWF